MRTCGRWMAALALCSSCVWATAQTLRSDLVVGGLNSPVFVTAAPGDSARLFVLEKAGLARIIKGQTVADTPFLDLRQAVSTISERGLLGLAFHPNYASNGWFYVYYVNLDGSIVVARYHVSSNSDVADAASGAILTTIPHPIFPNHNGGMIAFSPRDGYLYVGTGDGGGANDTFGNAQDLSKRLGKILRYNVGAAGDEFSVPPSNPFVSVVGADPGIWAYGVRNPWRFSFDRSNGDLYVGDVGQDANEEVDYQPAWSAGGLNFGWNVAEGFSCRGGSGDCGISNPAFTAPILDYPHNGQSRSITGGYVYRGSAIPGLQGTYFYADFVAGTIYSVRYNGVTISEQQDRTAELSPTDTPLGGISSFGEDAVGELYFCDYGGGRVFKIAYRKPFNPAADLNGDASINAEDVQLVINAALGLGPSGNAPDVNADGQVDAVDVQTVINAVLAT